MTTQAAIFPSQVRAPEFTSVATIRELGWWIPLFLFAAGWISYLFRTNLGFEIATAMGSVAVFRAIYLLITKCQDVRFTWVTACGLLLGYAFGSLNTALQLTKKAQTVAEHFAKSQDDLSIAISLVLWISAVLFLFGAIVEPPVRLNLSRLSRFDISYVYLGVLLYFAALATGEIGYMGSSVSDDRHVTVIGTIAGMLGPTLPAITIVLRSKSKLLSNQLFFWVLLVAEMLALLPSGRRSLIYSTLCVVFAFTVVGDRWRSPLWKKALLISTCLVSLYCLNVVFYAMRHAAEQTGAAKRMGAPDMSTSELVSSALKFIREGRDSHFDEDMANNLQDRTFVLTYFSDLVAQSRTHPALHGQLALFAFQMATPSSIYSLFGSKDKILAIGMEEMIANPNFGLYPRDDPNSLLTGGVSDFGIPGAFLYPIIIAMAFNIGIRVVLGRAPELMRLIALMMFVNALFETEMAVTGLVVSVRNIAFLFIGLVPMLAVARFFMRSPNRVPNQLNGKRPPSSLVGATLVRYEVISRSR